MSGAGIFDGDIIVVDRSITAVHEDIVLAVIFGEFTCKRMIINAESITLQAENPEHPNISVSSEHEFFVWGVCTFNLHRLRPIRSASNRCD